MGAELKPSARGLLYIAAAWMLIVLYSIFLTSAVETILEFLPIGLPPDSIVRHVVVFIYALAVVSFLGGSQIPAVFLKKKSFVVQFVFSATFGLFLIIITMSVRATFLKPFFETNPIIALEYLTVPYIFMIFIDLYLSGRLKAFCWSDFWHFIKGTFLYPKRTFEDLVLHRSICYSFVSVVFVSIVWMIRIAVFSDMSFTPTRWDNSILHLGNPLGWISQLALTIPVLLLLWLSVSVIAHFVGRKIGGIGTFSEAASLLGLSLLPSSVVILVDFLEFGLENGSFIVPDVIFLVSGFFIPLIVWPLILVTLAVKISESLSWRRSSLPAVVSFVPIFILVARIFL